MNTDTTIQIVIGNLQLLDSLLWLSWVSQQFGKDGRVKGESTHLIEGQNLPFISIAIPDMQRFNVGHQSLFQSEWFEDLRLFSTIFINNVFLQKLIPFLLRLQLIPELKRSIILDNKQIKFLPDLYDFKHMYEAFRTLNLDTNSNFRHKGRTSFRKQIFLNMLIMNQLINQILVLMIMDLAKTTLVVWANFAFFMSQNIVI